MIPTLGPLSIYIYTHILCTCTYIYIEVYNTVYRTYFGQCGPSSYSSACSAALRLAEKTWPQLRSVRRTRQGHGKDSARVEPKLAKVGHIYIYVYTHLRSIYLYTHMNLYIYIYRERQRAAESIQKLRPQTSKNKKHGLKNQSKRCKCSRQSQTLSEPPSIPCPSDSPYLDPISMQNNVPRSLTAQKAIISHTLWLQVPPRSLPHNQP